MQRRRCRRIDQDNFVGNDWTDGSRRVWHDLLAEVAGRWLYRGERLVPAQALRGRPRRRDLPSDTGTRQEAAENLLDRPFPTTVPNQNAVAHAVVSRRASQGAVIDASFWVFDKSAHR